MEMLVWAFLGGIVGALLMDVTEAYAAKRGIYSGVSVALIGRWFIGLLHGKVLHQNIHDTKSLQHEVGVGWAFHFLIGGGGVALIYPMLLVVLGCPLRGNHIPGGIVFGLATSMLPWFILLPSFGWGMFGRRGPQGSNPVLASTLSHIPYGFGVGAVITLGSYISH